MQWREKLAFLLGAASPFTFTLATAAEAQTDKWLDQPQPVEAHKDLLLFVDPAQRNRLIQLATHRSHSSHSSHSSHVSGYGHSSHYSGSTYSAPVYSPPPAPKPAPKPKPVPAPQSFYAAPAAQEQSSASTSSQAPATTEAKKFTQDELTDIIQKVKIALIIRGFDPGPVDGVYSPQMKTALGKFQAANNLPVTSLMDLQTLKLLNVIQ